MQLHFEAGTLVAPVLPDDAGLRALFRPDRRTGVFRAPAHRYRDIVEAFAASGHPLDDHARQYGRLRLTLRTRVEPFPHQQEALAAWRASGRRGTVELPTGAGKTLLAVLAIAELELPTLVVVPTLDLMAQWQAVLEQHLGVPVGLLGGGARERRELTVTTYDSAALQTDSHGHRFGFLVCDECHHLPAPSYRFVAEGSLAPYRLGLTATLARVDGGERLCAELIGPVCHRTPISELAGTYLARYEIRRVEVALLPEEQARHDAARERYLAFVRQTGIPLGSPRGWARFMAECQRSAQGRAAYRAYREQRQVALTSRAKLAALWRILRAHPGERVLVFTEDNDTVYRLSERLFLPALTHHTPVPERKALLAAFADGSLPVLLTSRVLNEGVDVPDAAVGVVLSGSGGVREHVQRLGRLLRRSGDKRAVLYEVVSARSAETGIGERRRQHEAYLAPTALKAPGPQC